MEKQIKSVFQTLNEVGFGENVEQKNNFSYLSWAHAWTYLKKLYPDAQRIVYEHDHTGLNYFSDGTTGYVKVGIVVQGLEHIDYLPIMDYRNQSIPLAKITSSDVNKSIQRSTAKAIAMHGLGIQLWTGEDIPDMVMESPIKTTPAVSKPAVAKAPTQKVAQKVNSEKPLLVISDDNETMITNYMRGIFEQGIDNIFIQLGKKYTINAKVKEQVEKIYKQLEIDDSAK